jgi:hypothetical protein
MRKRRFPMSVAAGLTLSLDGANFFIVFQTIASYPHPSQLLFLVYVSNSIVTMMSMILAVKRGEK